MVRHSLRTAVADIKKPLAAGFSMFGAGNRVRTGDLYLGKVPLYQLSYSRFCS